MVQATGLRHGDLGTNCRHLCVDMQRLLAEDTAWHMPWMKRVAPTVASLAAAHPSHTIFTRFVPARHPGEGQGTWRRYYERWACMTIEAIGEEMVGLIPELKQFVPPAFVLDKTTYSPWFRTDLDSRLRHDGVDALIVSGGETDVCVLSTVLGAVDRGYRVILAADAVCSSSDEAHDASLTVYATRYSQQVETATAAEILGAWG